MNQFSFPKSWLKVDFTNLIEANKNSLNTHSVVYALLNTGNTEMSKAGFLLSMNSLSRKTGKKRNSYRTACWVWWWGGK